MIPSAGLCHPWAGTGPVTLCQVHTVGAFLFFTWLLKAQDPSPCRCIHPDISVTWVHVLALEVCAVTGWSHAGSWPCPDVAPAAPVIFPILSHSWLLQGLSQLRLSAKIHPECLFSWSPSVLFLSLKPSSSFRGGPRSPSVITPLRCPFPPCRASAFHHLTCRACAQWAAARLRHLLWPSSFIWFYLKF